MDGIACEEFLHMSSANHGLAMDVIVIVNVCTSSFHSSYKVSEIHETRKKVSRMRRG